MVGFSVIDTGIGIARDKQQLIFEPFQQVSGPTTMVAGSMPVLRSASAIAGMAERLSASIPGNTVSDVRRAMQMRVDGDHAIDASGDQRADGLLADRFAFVESGVLAHVAEIRRQQDEAFRTSAPQRLGGEQSARSVSRSAGRATRR